MRMVRNIYTYNWVGQSLVNHVYCSFPFFPNHLAMSSWAARARARANFPRREGRKMYLPENEKGKRNRNSQATSWSPDPQVKSFNAKWIAHSRVGHSWSSNRTWVGSSSPIKSLLTRPLTSSTRAQSDASCFDQKAEILMLFTSDVDFFSTYFRSN